MPMKVLLNAMHTTTGGGLVYLQKILPYLAADTRFAFTLLIPPSTRAKMEIPAVITVWEAPVSGFWSGHLWEQFVLPLLARLKGFKVVWCNANYVPLLAPRAIPTLHTTPRAAAQAQTRGMRVYWRVLRVLTKLSLWRAPAALSVANHVIADYVGPSIAKKVVVASPAVDGAKVVEVSKKPFSILVVGDYYPQKNYPELLAAFSLLREQVPEATLDIVGRPVDPVVVGMVKAKIAAEKLEGVVTEVGPLPHGQLLAKMAESSLLVSLSRAECFNMPVLEAMAMGTPVVVGDYDFQREVADKAAVYVPLDQGGNVEAAVATAMYGVLSMDALTSRLVARGKEWAGRKTWCTTARTLAGVLADVGGVRAA